MMGRAVHPAARARVLAPVVTVQPCNHGCAGVEHRLLDFLIGNWLVRAASGCAIGTVTIAWEYGGCVLLERRSGVDGADDALGVIGYRVQQRQWHRDFLDRSGRLLTLDGRWDGTSLRLTGRDYPTGGSTRLHRHSWRPTADGSIEERWHTSVNGGRSWQVRASGTLRRYGE
jgi:hypothetical protein